jgi:hypothetical protein
VWTLLLPHSRRTFLSVCHVVFSNIFMSYGCGRNQNVEFLSFESVLGIRHAPLFILLSQIRIASSLCPPTLCTTMFCRVAGLCLVLCVTGCARAVDNSLFGKVVWGYQGWFGPSPKAVPSYGYSHWSRDGSELSASNPVFDAFPDFSEYPSSCLEPTNLKYRNGSRVQVYSATAGNGASVDVHFRWMKQYGIQAVFLQRFVTEIESFSGPRYHFRNLVTEEVAAAAAKHGRSWAVEWDVTGANTAKLEATLFDDFERTIKNYTRMPNYLHQDGKPVVAIFGFGFTGDRYPSDASASVNAIKNLQLHANVYVVGGVPYYWRTGTRDSRSDFQSVYSTFDSVSPWAVGRYNSISSFDALFTAQTQPDRAATAKTGQSYGPVIFPGFSWANLQQDPKIFNAIPRLGGKFFLAQASAYAKRLTPGADFVFGAMFDEWNESTAIAKIAATAADTPTEGCCWLCGDVDGVAVGSDHYLVLAGQLQDALNSSGSLN